MREQNQGSSSVSSPGVAARAGGERWPPEISQREAKWLLFASYGGGGMYPGDCWANAPHVYAKLERLGLVRLYEPHNPVHKNRAVATELGRALLKALAQHPQDTAERQPSPREEP